jgi:23S rRNA pseudouridine2605 synthase
LAGRVRVNGLPASIGQSITKSDVVEVDGQKLSLAKTDTIIMNKPAGYVCSRRGQGSKTIYELIPDSLHKLKPVGRLDKDSTGLLLMTNDGQLANQLTHPSFGKLKIYEVALDKPLQSADEQKILEGVRLKDGLSKFDRINKINSSTYEVHLREGRKRQIRRTFKNLEYAVDSLHRTQFGPYRLDKLEAGQYKAVNHLLK